jgi:hypothetical protein
MRLKVLYGVTIALVVGIQAWLLADGKDSGSPPAANSPSAPAPPTPPKRWGPGPYVVRFVTLTVKGPKPIKPPPPSPIDEEMNYGSSVALTPTP